jgi:hypothetical protein
MIVRSAFLIASALLIGGCDTAFRVRGEAPLTSNCRLAELKNGNEVAARPVSGRFEETFVSGVCCVPDKLQVICNGTVVKEIVDPYSLRAGQDPFVQPHELGLIAP